MKSKITRVVRLEREKRERYESRLTVSSAERECVRISEMEMARDLCEREREREREREEKEKEKERGKREKRGARREKREKRRETYVQPTQQTRVMRL